VIVCGPGESPVPLAVLHAPRSCAVEAWPCLRQSSGTSDSASYADPAPGFVLRPPAWWSGCRGGEQALPGPTSCAPEAGFSCWWNESMVLPKLLSASARPPR